MNIILQQDEDLKEFVEKLRLLRMDNIGVFFFEALPLCMGPTIAFSKFELLSKKIYTGAYELTLAYKKVYKNLLGEMEDDKYNLWIRSIHLENAILAYNSVRDYIYQVIYFNFELNLNPIIETKKIEIKSNEDILKLSKNIYGYRIKKLKKINKWLSKQENTKEFYSEFNKYRGITQNLNDLANDIKHKGCKVVKGTNVPRNSTVTRRIDGNDVNITELVRPRYVDIDQEILNLVVIHQKTLEIQIKLYKLCDFQGNLNGFLNSSINK